MMKSLKIALVLLTGVLSQAVAANPLYSWTTKDGTPTYSPDPPPKGVSYEIVGADLLPLVGQPVSDPQTTPAKTNQVETSAKPANESDSDDIVLTPAPSAAAPAKAAPVKARSAWKPVVYANDPNPQNRTREPAIAEAAPAIAPATQVSQSCLNFRQELNLLESQFATAFSAQQMDDAVVRLNEFRKRNKGVCDL